MEHAKTSRSVLVRHYALLALLCTVLFLLIHSYLLLRGHGLLWNPDGLELYYSTFVYEGKTIRNIVRSILKGKIPEVPFFLFTDGMGTDFFIARKNTLFDPFNLIAAVFPSRYAEYGFYFTSLLRFILVSWSFSAYCFHRGKESAPTMVGSLVYATSGYALMQALLRHPKFLNFATWLPLVLMEADKLFEGNRSWWLAVLIGFAFGYGPVSTYMTCFILLGYCVIKYFFAPRKRSVKDFVLLVLSFVVRLLLGFGLGSIASVPEILHLLSMKRVTNSGKVTPLLFRLDHYKSFLAYLMGLDQSKQTLYVGFTPVFLMVVFIICKKKFKSEERRPWLVGLFTVIVMMLIPWFGHMFNGFGYVTDRWMPAAFFCFAYIATIATSSLHELDKTEQRRVNNVMSVLFLLAAVSSVLSDKWKALYLVLPAFCALLFLRNICYLDRPRLMRAIACMVIIPAAYWCTVCFGPTGRNYAEEFTPLGKAWSMLASKSEAAVVAKYGADDQYRYDTAELNNVTNGAMLVGAHGIEFYGSLSSQAIDDYRKSMEFCNAASHKYGSNDQRLAAEVICGVKYFVASDSETQLVPYSFADTGFSRSGFHLYETENTLPIAFLYEAAIPMQEYEELSVAQRQEALLQGCVVDDASGFETIVPTGSATRCDYTIEETEGVEVDEGSFKVSGGKRELVLATECLSNCEVYLHFEGLEYSRTDAVEATDLISTVLKDLNNNDPSKYSLTVTTDSSKRSVTLPTAAYNADTGRRDWCINLGYFEKAPKKITVTFGKTGIYTFSTMEVICQPVEPIVNATQALQRGAATGIILGNDRITGTYNSPEGTSLAYFSVPYSKGWRATVDGHEAAVVKANIGFMAVPLEGAGNHVVELRYRTPGLIAGAVLTLGSLVCICILAWRGSEDRKKASGGHHAA